MARDRTTCWRGNHAFLHMAVSQSKQARRFLTRNRCRANCRMHDKRHGMEARGVKLCGSRDISVAKNSLPGVDARCSDDKQKGACVSFTPLTFAWTARSRVCGVARGDELADATGVPESRSVRDRPESRPHEIRNL